MFLPGDVDAQRSHIHCQVPHAASLLNSKVATIRRTQKLKIYMRSSPRRKKCLSQHSAQATMREVLRQCKYPYKEENLPHATKEGARAKQNESRQQAACLMLWNCNMGRTCHMQHRRESGQENESIA